MIIYILIGWYLIGLISGLFTIACMNKKVWGNWFITLGDLFLEIFLALLGVFNLIASLVCCISWFLEDNKIINFDKKIWKKN